MKVKIKNTLLIAIGTLVVLVSLTACGNDPRPANATVEVPSGRSPNASVSGTVTYRERLAISPGAKLVVELRDVSYADAARRLSLDRLSQTPDRSPSSSRSITAATTSTPGMSMQLAPTSSNRTVASPSPTIRLTR